MSQLINLHVWLNDKEKYQDLLGRIIDEHKGQLLVEGEGVDDEGRDRTYTVLSKDALYDGTARVTSHVWRVIDKT